MSVGIIVTGFVLSVIIILTIAGNMLVFLAVISQRKLRYVSNYFIVSLSVADLLVAILVMIPATLNEIFLQWMLGVEMCSIWASCDVMLCSASILNVCLISLDRYMAIMSPLRYNTLMTHKRALILIATAWMIAMFTSFIPIQNGWHNIDTPSLENLTMFSEKPLCLFIVSFPYAITASTVTVLLPIIIAFVLYYRVSKEAQRQAFFVGTLIAPSRLLLGKDVSTKTIREPYTSKATITLGVIVGAYTFTWAPFLVINLTDSICRCIPPKLFIGCVWLGYCNSLINPVIYPLFMRDFRKVYIKLFQSCFSKLKFWGEKSKVDLN